MNRRGRIALAVGLASTVAVIGGVTVSATAETDADATISACAKQTNGGLRLADECRRSEVPVSWNVEGPAGPPGPADLTVMLRERRQTFTVQPVSSGQGPGGASSFCQPGEVAISGGMTTFGADLFPLEYFASGPAGTGTGWYVDWINPTDEPVTASVTIGTVCVPGSVTVVP